MNKKCEKEVNFTYIQWALEKTLSPDEARGPGGQLDVEMWKCELRIQSNHTRLLFYRNWDDKFMVFKSTTFVIICCVAREN